MRAGRNTTRGVTCLLVALCAGAALAGSPPVPQAPRRAARDSRPGPSLAATRQQAPDGVALLLQKIQQAVRAGDTAAYQGLVAAADGGLAVTTFASLVIRPGVTGAVVRERDRAALKGVAPGDGYGVMADVFCEFGTHARLSTWRFDIVRDKSSGPDEWTIRADEMVSAFAALYNLALSPREYAANNLVIAAEDLELRLPDGTIYVAETSDGPTALVLIGPGQVVFRPTPASEREQMRIFSGSDAIDTTFKTAFVRIAPSSLRSHIKRGTMVERTVDPSHAKAAADLFRTDSVRSFGVNLGDLADKPWSLLPAESDFLAEIHTKRFGVLTYTRSLHQAEDISLFNRAAQRQISLYASAEKIETRGMFYDEDDSLECDVQHYEIDASLDPQRDTMSGLARLTVRVRSELINSLTLMLADSLGIDSVTSREFGRVVVIRIIEQNRLLINLPKKVPKGTVLGFTIAYHGRITPQFIDREAVAVGQREQQEEDQPEFGIEPSYLYSNQSYWYPQTEANAFATATVRVKIPAGYACVASGDPDTATDDTLARVASTGSQYVFRALQPVRYLSLLVARLQPVRATQIVMTGGEPSGAGVDRGSSNGTVYRDVDLKSFAAPRLRGRASAMADRAADILRFYGSLIGECPYPTMTLALVERELPGGHSPAYLAVVSQPVIPSRLEWRSDPTGFPQFPEFFLAHEIAHQWWGQAVGWKNYHEQWLSEGLAQYFAALYAERQRGKGAFDGMMQKMQEWAVKKSAEGPVYLGYRIGHVKRDPQLFRAIVYNKSAVVLHMLRRLIGDDAFMRGLRRFYQEYRFRKAGSDDLRRVFEAESHVSLTRFFERWIYESTVPRLKFSSRIESDASGRQVAVVRFEQAGEPFDLPVTVTFDYDRGDPVDVIVAVTDAVTEARVPLAGKLRSIEVNRDRLAIAHISR